MRKKGAVMTKICEITRKKAKSLKEGEKRPNLLKRSIEVPELKGSVRLRVSSEGMEVLKKTGGLVNFLKERDEKKLSPKLYHLKVRLGLPTHREIEEAKAKEEAKQKAKEEKEAKAAEAAAKAEAEAAKEAAAEKTPPKEEKKEEAVEEKKEAAPSEKTEKEQQQ